MLHPELAARECAAAWLRPEEHALLSTLSLFIPALLIGCRRLWPAVSVDKPDVWAHSVCALHRPALGRLVVPLDRVQDLASTPAETLEMAATIVLRGSPPALPLPPVKSLRASFEGGHPSELWCYHSMG